MFRVVFPRRGVPTLVGEHTVQLLEADELLAFIRRYHDGFLLGWWHAVAYGYTPCLSVRSTIPEEYPSVFFVGGTENLCACDYILSMHNSGEQRGSLSLLNFRTHGCLECDVRVNPPPGGGVSPMESDGVGCLRGGTYIRNYKINFS